MNTVTVSFNTTVRQKIKMSQQEESFHAVLQPHNSPDD